MSDNASGLFNGVLVGLAISLVIFLLRQDFLQQQCDNLLIKENKPRNLVCVVRMRAEVINKLKDKSWMNQTE